MIWWRASSERQAKAKENISHAKTNVESKTINLALVEDVIQQIETFVFDDENQYTIASNHYSMINLAGKVNPWQSLQECIEGKATYVIPGYPWWLQTVENLTFLLQEPPSLLAQVVP